MRYVCNLLKSRNFERKMSIFTQKINPITGKNDWELQDEDYDFHQEIARSAFADMLHDKERNKKYYLGLKAAIAKMHEAGKPAHVLDIGTGTGLLSMMAARCGAETVTACEAFKPIADCAIKIIKENGFENKITVISKRSTDLIVGDNKDLKQKANILVTEVFDTELIGEGALGTFTHAHKYLLESDCMVIPTCATIYGQIVQSSILDNWNRLNIFQHSTVILPTAMQRCQGAASVHDLQLSQIPVDSIKFLSEPTEIFHFDWSGKTPLPFQLTNSKHVQLRDSGTAQAVFMWWDLWMDEDKTVLLSCAPFWAHPNFENQSSEGKCDSIPWRDHWMQAVYYLPEELPVTRGEEINLIGCHDEFSLWFNLKSATVKVEDKDYEKPVCDCGLHVAFSRTRLGQMNNTNTFKKYLEIFKKTITSESVCVFLGDGNFLALIASTLKPKKIFCLETNYLSQYVINSIAEENSDNKLVILKSLDDLNIAEDSKLVNLIFSEPYFTSSILPWDNLHLLYLIKQLQTVISCDKVDVYPKRAIIRGLAVEFFNLHKIKAPLGECESFQMGHFDNLIKNSSDLSDANVEPHPLWEYSGIALSKIFDIAEFDCTKPLPEKIEENSDIVRLEGGTCNGVALWIDWDIDGTSSNTITTGPNREKVEIGKKIVEWDMHTRQGVYFVPEIDNEYKTLKYFQKYEPKDGIISFSFTFS